MQNKSICYSANTLSDVIYQLQNVSGLKVVGGLTLKNCPTSFLFSSAVNEFSNIDRHERYTDIGSAVTLQRICESESILPQCIVEAAKSIANVGLRNIATIGGNVMANDFYHTLVSPLLALDARLEVHTTTEIQYLKILQLNSLSKPCILTKIRLPTDEWKISIFRRFGNLNYVDSTSSAFTFLCDWYHDILYKLRISFTGPMSFRTLALENNLIGSRLPLSKNIIEDAVSQTISNFDSTYQDSPLSSNLRESFINLLRYSLYLLN